MTESDRTHRPFDALRAALSPKSPASETSDEEPRPDVRPDGNRAARTGIPEIVLAESKTLSQVVESLTRLTRTMGRAVASRCSAEMMENLPARFESRDGFDCAVDVEASAVIVQAKGHPGSVVTPTGGIIGIITAGTSDIRVAAEAGLIATEMGCDVVQVRDVGVAGLHRLVQPLEALVARDVGAVIVVAGMDGALPSVVAGLVDVPVIGLPTSVGYGFGGRGEAALLAMLQSCALGLVVVNIDNGIGAGAAAARIANRLALTRR